MRGGWWLAGFLAALYVAIWCYTASDGPDGVKLQAPFACLLLGSAGTFGCTATGLWAIRYQADRLTGQLREHVDARLEWHRAQVCAQIRAEVRADTGRLLTEEITHVLPRLDAQMLHALQRAFKAEAGTLTRAIADQGFRSGLVARATAAVPAQPGARILPLRARED
jgi:hypothetical protein